MSAPLSIQLEEATAELLAAQTHYAEVSSELAVVKGNLEYRRAELICNGVEGKYAEQREATIRLELSDAYADFIMVEQEATRAKCRLERAQVSFTAIRYHVRLLEVLKGMGA